MQVKVGLGQRFGAIFMGLFLFSFGMPFTLTPLMIFGDVGASYMDPFELLFLCAFTLPFLLAGLGVQYMGIRTILMGIRGEVTTPDAKFVYPESVDEPEYQTDIDKFDPPEPGKDGWWEEESES